MSTPKPKQFPTAVQKYKIALFEQEKEKKTEELKKVDLLLERMVLVGTIEYCVKNVGYIFPETTKWRLSKFIRTNKLPLEYFKMLLALINEATKNKYKDFECDLNACIPVELLNLLTTLVKNKVFMKKLELYLEAKEVKQNPKPKKKTTDGFHLIYTGRERQ